ncbi:chemotaxis protein CheA [Novosphingobium soli]
MDELLEQFLVEGRELVAQAAHDLSALEQDPRDEAAVDSAFRAMHTLKGSFAIFALAPAERLLHAAEDVLHGAREGTTTLNARIVSSLVACLDQVDRWVEAVGRDGALPEDAAGVSARTIALLGEPGRVAPGLPGRGSADPPWLTALREREAAVIAAAASPLVAFHYAPDRECFFRGDDPLAIAEAIPELIALAVLPSGDRWPSSDELEPFTCFSVLEGLSTASEADMRAAFRLQPDQVELIPLLRDAEPRRGNEAAGETSLLRVEAGRVDALGDGLGDLIVAVNALAPLAAEAALLDPLLAARLRTTQADIERATDTLHRALSRVRLVPLEPSLRRLPRLAREIAETLGKQVTFTLAGAAIEVDKQIADGLFEPLLHLVRNAIDHGVEPPQARNAAGKDAVGRVTLEFRREGDAIIATLSDDGAGMDLPRIRRAAVDRALISKEAADALDDAEALRLIFRPGFSTAAEVSEISGRGVGMDAVQAAIARLRGAIEIDSQPGTGTRFRIRLPVQALTTRLLVVEAGGERYGVSLDQVAETVRVDAAALMPVGSGLACVLRERTVPVLDLATLLKTEPARGLYAKLVVTEVGGNPVALRVDSFSERIDTVLRPPRGILASAPGVIGSAVMSDGGVLIVLDLPELAA